jgi:2',3'-cyclic-nucleotide 2'-phosphodiesterase (5'-nucleotidase family)
VNICYNLVTNTYEVQELEILDEDTFSDSALADDPIVSQLYSQYFSTEDPYTTVLGRNNVLRSSNEIGHTVAQLYLEKGKQIWGEQYDVVLGGGFIKTRTPYDLSAGDVTYSQLFSLLPFDNALVLCQVTGKELREKFLNSSSYFIACDDSLRSSVDDGAFYYVLTDTYTSFYKYNLFTEIDRLENYYARDLLRDFIAAGGWGGQAQAISIAQANAIGEALGENETSTQAYQLTGVVTSVENTTYGNLYITDDQGDTFYIYGLYDSTGRIRYDAMANPPQVGDTITVNGAITKYVGYYGQIIEMKSACLQ